MKLLLSILCVGTWIFVTPVQSRALYRFKRAEIYSANETACMVDNVLYNNGDPVPSSDPCEMCICRLPGFACTLTECEEKEGCQRIKKEGECCSYLCDTTGESSSAATETKEPEVSSVTIESHSEVFSEVKETTKAPEVEIIQTDETTKGTESVLFVSSSDKPEEREAHDEETERDPTTKEPQTESPSTERPSPKEETTSVKEESSEPEISTVSTAPSYASGTTKEETKRPTSTEGSSIVTETEPATDSTESSVKKEGRSDETETLPTTEQGSEHPVESKQTTEELSTKEESSTAQETEASTAPESIKVANEETKGDGDDATPGLYKNTDESLKEGSTSTSTPSERESSESSEASRDTSEQSVNSETEAPTKPESTEIPSSTAVIDKQDAGRSHEVHTEETSSESKVEPSTTVKPEEEKEVTDDKSSSVAAEEPSTIATTRIDVVRKRFIDWVDYVPRDFHV